MRCRGSRAACSRPAGEQQVRAAERDRLWIGSSARTHAGQLDVSPFPEILHAQRRHLAQLDHHPWQDVETTISAATHAIYQALRDGTWIPGQRQRLQQLAPAPGNRPWPGYSAAAPAGQTTAPAKPSPRSHLIFPDVSWLTPHSRAHSASHRAAS